MGIFLTILAPIHLVNSFVLRIGNMIGIFAVAMMVLAIIIQVVCRYVFNNALPWPDEAARFCMLWMTGCMAPIAFRNGGFVAIDMLQEALPRVAKQIVILALLTLSLIVLVVAVQIGWKDVTGFGGRFATASLYLPTSISFDSWFRVPRSWMMASILLGCGMLLMVNIELILRSLITLMGGQTRLPVVVDSNNVAGGE